jgi:hypothetical protein
MVVQLPPSDANASEEFMKWMRILGNCDTLLLVNYHIF